MRVVGIATYNRPKSIRQTIESIHPHVDLIHLSINGAGPIPSWCKDFDKLEVGLTNNSVGDLFKFRTNNTYPQNVTFYTCDDDLSYSAKYFDYLEQRSKELECVVTLHGRRYDQRIAQYYSMPVYMCLRPLNQDVDVDFGGTGVMCFQTKHYQLDWQKWKYKNMADVVVGCDAHRKGQRIVCLKHEVPSEYITHNKIDLRKTIHAQQANRGFKQTALMNQYFRNVR